SPMISLKEVFIDFPDVQAFLDAAANIVPDHQSSQLPTVDQHDALAQIFGGIASTGGEGRCGDEQALGGLVPVKTGEEIADRPGAYAVARCITFGLDINSVQSQFVLIDHAINAIVSAAPERAPSFSNR